MMVRQRYSNLENDKIKFLRKSIIFNFLCNSLSALLFIGCLCILLLDNYASFGFSIIIPLLVIANMAIVLYFLTKRDKRAIVSFLALVTFFCFFSSFFQMSFKKKQENSISILSYNVKGFSMRTKYTHDKVEGCITRSKESVDNRDKKIINFIAKNKPDIVVIQEFNYLVLKDLLEYPHFFLGYRHGVEKSSQIILSKFPIVNKGYIDFPNSVNNAMFVDLVINEETVRVYNLHLQSFGVVVNSKMFNKKSLSSLLSKISSSQKMRIEQVEQLKAHMKDFKGRTIICGDFNSTQYSKTYRKLKRGKKDTFIEKGNGLGMTYSLFGYPLRLDYVLVDKAIDVISHENFNLNFSDHEPVYVKLGLN